MTFLIYQLGTLSAQDHSGPRSFPQFTLFMMKKKLPRSISISYILQKWEETHGNNNGSLMTQIKSFKGKTTFFMFNH